MKKTKIGGADTKAVSVPGTPCSRRWFTGLPLCAGPYPCSSDCHFAQDRSLSQATATLRRTGLVLSRAPLYPGGAPRRWRLEKVSTRLTYIAKGRLAFGKSAHHACRRFLTRRPRTLWRLAFGEFWVAQKTPAPMKKEQKCGRACRELGRSTSVLGRTA